MLREKMLASKVIVIVRGLAPAHMEGLARALYAGGIRLIEVTFAQDKPNTWQDTANAIRMISSLYPDDLIAGAGTVMTKEQVHLAHQAGARYIISPNVNEAVIHETKALGLLSLPGALTPTEIVHAHALGADFVKVFPAGNLGPAYMKALCAPLPHIPMMAVGGVTEQNIGAFLQAGAVGAGVGGNLVNKEWIEAGAWARITALAQAYVDAANEAW